MPTMAQAELTIVFSEDLGTQSSSRFIEKIKAYSKTRFQRAVFNTNRLFLNFEGDEELTGFLISLIKMVSEAGKECKIGVRDYYVPYYELSFDCDYVGKLKIPFTQAVICNGKTCRVVFKDVEKDFLRKGSIKRIMSLISSKTSEKTWKILYKNDIPSKGLLNPNDEIEKKGLVKKGLARNEYFYLPPGMREMTKLKHLFLDSLSKERNLEEFFPLSHLSFSLLEGEDIMELVPPEIFENVFCEVEKPEEAAESYFITGSVKSISAKPKGVIYDELPFNLYKAMEKQFIKNPQVFYTQKKMKLFVTFLEPSEDYASSVQNIREEIKKIIEGLRLNFRIISRNVNGEAIRFEGFLPYNKTWITLIEAMFSEDFYTKPFKIEGKSGQVNLNLENIFLAQIAQGTISLEVPIEEKFKDEKINDEEIPTDYRDNLHEI
jgi:hypothetical protein